MQGLKAQESQLAQLRSAIKEAEQMLAANAAWRAHVVIAKAQGKVSLYGWPVLKGGAK